MTFECTLTLDHHLDQFPKRFRALWFEAREALSVLTDIQVEIVLPSGMAPSTILGAPACLFMSSRTSDPTEACTRYGVVASVEHVGNAATLSLYRLELVPRVGLLKQRRRSRAFSESDVKTIVETVLESAGLNVGAALGWRAEPRVVRNLCVQFRETDLDFISRLLEEEGLAYRFVHRVGAEVLEVFDDKTHRSSEPERLLPLMSIVGRDAVFEVRPNAATVVDRDHRQPQDHRVRATTAEVQEIGVIRQREIELYPGKVVWDTGELPGAVESSASEATMKSQQRLQAEQVRGEVFRVIGNWVGVRPGTLVRLESGELYYVIRVEQESTRLAPTALDEDTYSQQLISTVLELIPSTRRFRPPLRTPRSPVLGLQSAVVIGGSPGSVCADRLGRVHVAFAWESVARDPQSHVPFEGVDTNRCWVRTLNGPWAGPNWGHQFIPRVGTEVAVAFLDGDPDRPLVVGALYNGAEAPPYDPIQHPLRNGIRSHSERESDVKSEIFFDDAAGAEVVHLGATRDLEEVTGRQHRVIVGEDQMAKVKGHRHATVGRDDETVVKGSYRLDAKEHVRLKGGEDIRLVVGQSESLLQTDSAHTKAPRSIELSCGGTRILITPETIILQTAGGGRLELSGSKVMVDAETAEARTLNATLESSATVAIQSQSVKINS